MFNLASHATIQANATCGQNRQEVHLSESFQKQQDKLYLRCTAPSPRKVRAADVGFVTRPSQIKLTLLILPSMAVTGDKMTELCSAITKDEYMKLFPHFSQLNSECPFTHTRLWVDKDDECLKRFPHFSQLKLPPYTHKGLS